MEPPHRKWVWWYLVHWITSVIYVQSRRGRPFRILNFYLCTLVNFQGASLLHRFRWSVPWHKAKQHSCLWSKENLLTLPEGESLQAWFIHYSPKIHIIHTHTHAHTQMDRENRVAWRMNSEMTFVFFKSPLLISPSSVGWQGRCSQPIYLLS